MRKIILASASIGRKKLLEEAGLVFEVFPSNYEEDMTLQLIPSELAKFLSKGKAEDVAKNFSDAIIISADTFVSFENKIIGKPNTEEDARKILKMLSNKQHSVFTGFTILDTKNNKMITKVVETKVFFKELSDEVINNYIKDEQVLKYAGAYTCRDVIVSNKFIEKIEYDPSNVEGLPVSEVIETLKEFELV